MKPGLAARAGVGLAASMLPAGERRTRYHQEFLADLAALSRGRQTTYAVGALVKAGALRAALRYDEPAVELTVQHAPLLCRLHLKHEWHVVSTDDGVPFRRCSRCGSDDDGSRDGAGISGFIS